MVKRSLGWVTLWAALAIQGACRADDGYFGSTGGERARGGDRFGDGSGGTSASGSGGDALVVPGDTNAATADAATVGATVDGSGPSGGGPDGDGNVTPAVCQPEPHEDDCPKCVKKECCPELDACTAAAGCSCWLDCVAKNDPEDCSGECGPWDAEWTALVACAQVHCPSKC